MTLVRRLLDKLYSRQRGLDSGFDESLQTADLYEFVAGKGQQALRSFFKGYPGRFMGRSVRLNHRRHLTIGNRVALADDVTINALSRTGVSLGDSVTVDAGAILRGSGVVRNLGEGIEIGPRTAIGARNVLLGAGGIVIGADCLIGPNVTIVSENHRHADPNVPIRAQGEERLRTVIEDDVWIGANVVVLGGAHIERGAIVAAGAVVKGRVTARTIVGGVPARMIQERIS